MPVPTLVEGQYDLDGYTFGALTDEVVLLESGVEWGQTGVRTQDVEAPLGDSLLFGRDYLSPPVWTFTMGARHATDVDQVIGRLSAAWRADAVRTTPGARSTLHYKRAGLTCVAYGRPRRFAVETPKVYQTDFRIVTADFQLSDATTYAAVADSLTITLLRTSIASGLVFPVTFPVTFGSQTSSRAGTVTVNGSTRTPFTVRVNGPVTGSASQFMVSSTGGADPWGMDLPVTLTPGQWVEIDTATGVVLRNGSPVQLALGRGSNLNARLSPGSQELTFTADDPSQTSSAVVTWRVAAATPM